MSPPRQSPPPEPFACQPMQMLERIARQSGLGNPDGFLALLALISTGKLLRSHLQRVLTGLGLNEIKFSTLVTLYSLDPDPSTPAELALQSRVSRAAMTDTLESLRGLGWVDRERSSTDRRTLLIRLTARGRTVVERAVRPFLAALAGCSESLTAAELRALTRTCARVCGHFPSPSA